MLGSLPKLFDKNFVIGFLLPAIVALVLFAWLVPGFSLLTPLRSLGSSEKALGDLTYLALLSYGVALLLMMTNTLQFRLVEGYLGPLARWTGGRLRHKAHRDSLAAELAALEVRALNAPDTLTAADRDRGDALNLSLVNDYPPRDQPVLPTGFGNAIRAFESYPLEVYGADGPPVWLRLSSVIPERFAAELEDARARVNFLLNLLFVLLLFAAAALALAAAATPWERLAEFLHTGEAGSLRPASEFLAALAAIALIPAVYAFAVNQAKAWGDIVKAAFDCYLPALIEQLGYERPVSGEERAAFWAEFNALIMYRQPMEKGHYRLAGVPPPLPVKRRLLRSLIAETSGTGDIGSH